MSTLTKYCQFHVLSTYAKVFSERKPIPFWKLQKRQLLDVLAISIKKVDNMIDRRSLYPSWLGIGNIAAGPTSHESRHYLRRRRLGFSWVPAFFWERPNISQTMNAAGSSSSA